MAIGLKVCIKKVEGQYYLCSVIKIRSHDTAQFVSLTSPNLSNFVYDSILPKPISDWKREKDENKGIIIIEPI